MTKPKNILCVCYCNSDRSPVMSAVLDMYLKNGGNNILCESAGVNEKARYSGVAPFSIIASKRLCLHPEEYQKLLVDKYEISADKIYNAQVSNPWPCKFQEQYDVTMENILVAMYRIVKFYF